MPMIRERPPLRLNASVAAPNGHVYRWGQDDDDPTNSPSDLSFSTTMPGGFEQASLTLARQTGIDYADLAEFSTVTLAGLGGGQVAWEGRMERLPRTSGDQMSVSPGLVGWQSHLDDNSNAREIYVDIDMSRWQGMSDDRKAQLLGGGSYNLYDGASVPASGTSAVVLRVDSPWYNPFFCEAWYDSEGIPVKQLWAAWKLVAGINYADMNWWWGAMLSSDFSGMDSNGVVVQDLAGPGTLSFDNTGMTDPAQYAAVQLGYSTGLASSGIQCELDWTNLTVIGDHGIGFGGSWGATPGTAGPTSSQVVRHAVAKYAPLLSMIRGGVSTVQDTAFLIPQLTFFEPTTCGEIITQANKYELYDWWVDEGPTFNYAPRGSYGRSWRARVGPARLSEAGPQIDHLWNGVVVSYRDTNGVGRTVGPPGSNSYIEDGRLLDTDPANPANTIPNLKRWTRLQMQTVGKNPDTNMPDAAIKIGQTFLSEQRKLNTSGNATLVGHVEDDRGVLWPAWMVRAGDSITFVDAHDPVERRIVRTEYSDATKSCQVSLDSPAEGLQAYLDRLSVSMQPIGFT